MTHYVQDGGRFALAAQRLIAEGFNTRWVACVKQKASPASNRNKVAYQCPQCQTKAWGKPGLNIMCGDCCIAMRCDEEGDANEQ